MVTTTNTIMFVLEMLITTVVIGILVVALVSAGRALVVAQYDVHAPSLPRMGDGAALYPGADRVHGDAQGFGGLGYR